MSVSGLLLLVLIPARIQWAKRVHPMALLIRMFSVSELAPVEAIFVVDYLAAAKVFRISAGFASVLVKLMDLFQCRCVSEIHSRIIMTSCKRIVIS